MTLPALLFLVLLTGLLAPPYRASCCLLRRVDGVAVGLQLGDVLVAIGLVEDERLDVADARGPAGVALLEVVEQRAGELHVATAFPVVLHLHLVKQWRVRF
jgi:hypothetical protein